MTKNEFELEQDYLDAQEKVRSSRATDKDVERYKKAKDAFAQARQERKVEETKLGLRPATGGVKVDEE